MASALFVAFHERFLGDGQATVFTSDTKIEEVRKAGKLVVLEVLLADVLEHRATDALYDVGGIWIAKGDCRLVVDFEAIEITDRDDVARHATLRVPLPVIDSPRVDMERSTTYHVDAGWLADDNAVSAMNNQAFQSAQSNFKELAGRRQVLASAKTNAEMLLSNQLRMLGWEATIEWVD